LEPADTFDLGSSSLADPSSPRQHSNARQRRPQAIIQQPPVLRNPSETPIENNANRKQQNNETTTSEESKRVVVRRRIERATTAWREAKPICERIMEAMMGEPGSEVMC